jgi:hypothetical protein
MYRNLILVLEIFFCGPALMEIDEIRATMMMATRAYNMKLCEYVSYVQLL